MIKFITPCWGCQYMFKYKISVPAHTSTLINPELICPKCGASTKITGELHIEAKADRLQENINYVFANPK